MGQLHAAVVATIALALAFNIVSGFNDGGNLLAAATASRTVSPRAAFLLISLGALVGPIVAGTGVAATIGHGIVNYNEAGILPLAASIVGGLVAVLSAYTWRFPTSASVAIVSATIGSMWALGKLNLVHWHGVVKVAASLFGSILVGFLAGALFYAIALVIFSRVSFRTGYHAMRLQYATVFTQALGYGANDAEKMMGLIVAAMLVGSHATTFATPFWVVAAAVVAFSLGMAVGGVRIARTIGGKLFRIRPLHAFAFQSASALTVLLASSLGGPLSTTETTASSMLGVGAVSNVRAVRWQVARDLIAAWILTVPIGIVCGALATLLMRILMHPAQ